VTIPLLYYLGQTLFTIIFTLFFLALATGVFRSIRLLQQLVAATSTTSRNYMATKSSVRLLMLGSVEGVTIVVLSLLWVIPYNMIWDQTLFCLQLLLLWIVALQVTWQMGRNKEDLIHKDHNMVQPIILIGNGTPGGASPIAPSATLPSGHPSKVFPTTGALSSARQHHNLASPQQSHHNNTNNNPTKYHSAAGRDEGLSPLLKHSPRPFLPEPATTPTTITLVATAEGVGMLTNSNKATNTSNSGQGSGAVATSASGDQTIDIPNIDNVIPLTIHPQNVQTN
jgi:hypothetical protein